MISFYFVNNRQQRNGFESWTEVCGSERLTGAMLDRLTHKVHIIKANGTSYRLEKSRKRLARQNKRAGQN